MIGNTKIVDFGVIFASKLVSEPAGSPVGPARTIVFSLKAADGLASCEGGNTNVRWIPITTIDATQVGFINSFPGNYWYLKNTTAASSGGSDVWLKLMLLEGGVQTQPPYEASGAVNFSTSTQGYSLTSSVSLVARLVRSVDGVPTNGPFTQSIPVTVNYK